MQLHTLLHKNCWINLQCMRYFIVVTKQEILVISLTDFFYAASRQHDDVIYGCQRYAECLQTVFQQDSAPAYCTAHVHQLNCCVKKHQTFLRPTCGLQTAQISVLWITRSWLSCSVMSTRDKSILWINWQRLIDGWYILERSVFEEAIDQWRGRVRACVCAKAGHFEYSLWTDDVDFVHVCYTLVWLVWLLHL